MTEKDEERSFEDHFDELAGDAVPEAPEMSIPDETDEGESHAAQEEERRRANLTGTRAGR